MLSIYVVSFRIKNDIPKNYYKYTGYMQIVSESLKASYSGLGYSNT